MSRFFYIIVFVSLSFALKARANARQVPEWECKARITASGIDPLTLNPDEVIALTPSLIWKIYKTQVGWLTVDSLSSNAIKSAHSPDVLEKIMTYLLVFGDDPDGYEEAYRKSFGGRNSSLAVQIYNNVRFLMCLISIIDAETGETRAMDWGLEMIKRLKNVPSSSVGNGGIVIQLRRSTYAHYPAFKAKMDDAIRERFPHLELN